MQWTVQTTQTHVTQVPKQIKTTTTTNEQIKYIKGE